MNVMGAPHIATSIIKSERDLPKTPVDWLKREYARRESRNPRFSLRAFAHLLGVAPGALCEILAAKRKLSLQLGERCAERLKLTTEDKKRFIELVKRQEEVSQKIRRVKRMTDEIETFKCLDEDIFNFISDWHHFAILSLRHTQDFQPDVRWVASRLTLPAAEVQNALERLERLGLIRRDVRAGTWETTESQLTTGKDVPSEAIRRFHDQCLTRAKESLREVPVSARDITSITMAIDPARLNLAKDMIRHFRRQLAELLEDSDANRTEVYQLNIQLLPLTKLEKERN